MFPRIMVVSLSIPMAWLRLRSGSVWPAAILHAAHNLFIQGFFDRVTVDTGPTRWLTGEFGAALLVALGVTAWLFWRARAAVQSPEGLPPQHTADATRAETVPARP